MQCPALEKGVRQPGTQVPACREGYKDVPTLNDPLPSQVTHTSQRN